MHDREIRLRIGKMDTELKGSDLTGMDILIARRGESSFDEIGTHNATEDRYDHLHSQYAFI